VKPSASIKSLVALYWPNQISGRLFLSALLVILGVLIISISAKIQIAFYPIPVTMQTFAVLVIGMAFGRWLGALTASVYLIAAILGLPVLAGGSEKSADFALLTTPTSGFLIGFIVAAWTVGWLGELGWGKTVRWALCAMIIGTCVILLLGMFWLTLTYSWSGEQVLNSLIGLMPGAILKIALASVLVPFLWREASA
jgi:biotin transport system substrate-specific component|tara:strand:+ start:3701 stop:4291 length:591 start_codon:yes stop_codon:yes gene_type:complete